MRRTGGTPIEEAPLWALAILTTILALIFFPALIGLAESFGLDTRGRRLEIAGAAAAIALLLVSGLARQRRWRRAAVAHPLDDRPLFVRFSTWLWTTLLFPNFLHGLLVLMRSPAEGRLDPRAAWLVGLGVAAIQGVWALLHRLRHPSARV